MTNLPKSRISESVRELRNYGIVTQKRNSWIKYSIGINKKFKIAKKKRVTQKRNEGVTELRTTKDTITKESTIVSSKADTSLIDMKLLNENQHSDEWETVLDIDTGKPVQKILKDVDPNVASAMWQMITWAVKEKRQNILFPNLGKQFKALKILRLMGIQPCQIQERWAELQEDSFYQKAGIDFMSLVKSFERKI